MSLRSALTRQFLRSFVLAFATTILATVTATAAPRELEWADLQPQLPPIADPLAALDSEQRIELETILWVRQLNDTEREQRAEIVKEAKVYEEKFRKNGVSIDDLIADYVVFDQKVTQREQLVNESLSGADVTLTGYLLPLEFSEDGETEFLLVPYVGACIHVPPPPPNQIVLVTLATKFRAQEVFTPVRISGTMSTKAASKKLYLVDGTSDVSVGYHLDDGTIELIKE